MRGAGIMGGIDAITCPGARRTTGATCGLGITGTADRRVVRTGGGNCLQITHSWFMSLKKNYSILVTIHFLKQLTEEGGRGTAVIGGVGLGKMAADESMGGW